MENLRRKSSLSLDFFLKSFDVFSEGKIFFDLFLFG